MSYYYDINNPCCKIVGASCRIIAIIAIYELVNYAWAGMGSAFGPLVITALYSKKVNKYGAIAGIITGSLVSGVWYLFNTGVPPLIPGFILSHFAIYLVSCLTANRGEQKGLIG